jgi:hypothetical protein
MTERWQNSPHLVDLDKSRGESADTHAPLVTRHRMAAHNHKKASKFLHPY